MRLKMMMEKFSTPDISRFENLNGALKRAERCGSRFRLVCLSYFRERDVFVGAKVVD